MEQNNSKVRYVAITALHAGQRVDNFLVTFLKNIPKSRIYKALRKGEVRANKKRIKPEYRLVLGDELRIPPFVITELAPEKVIPSRLEPLFQAMCLYEDDDLLIINKPAKFAVHSGSGVEYGIIDIAKAFHPQGEALQLVHRLDRDTSGCLILSKNRPTLVGLQAQLNEHKITKTYLALTKGHWPKKEVTIEVSLRKNSEQSGERMVKVDEEGKSAKTVFRVIKTFAKASLVEVDLHSGRTHQIRVHAQHAGHPLAGDDKYGDDYFTREMKEYGLKRLFLHAKSLQFISPVSHKKIQVTAPLPEELELVLTQIGEKE